ALRVVWATDRTAQHRRTPPPLLRTVLPPTRLRTPHSRGAGRTADRRGRAVTKRDRGAAGSTVPAAMRGRGRGHGGPGRSRRAGAAHAGRRTRTHGARTGAPAVNEDITNPSRTPTVGIRPAQHATNKRR